MVPHPDSDTGLRPTKGLDRFHGHQAVRRIGKDMGRSESGQFLMLHALQKLGACHSIFGMRLKVIDKDVRVEKNSDGRGNIREDHDCSCRSSSGLVATKSATSA